jgi:hypothetical protein
MSLIHGSANRGWLWPSGPDQVKPRRDSGGRAWDSRITRRYKGLTMLVRIILACSAILLLGRPGVAADCQTLDQAGREQVLRQAPTCDKANELFGDCAYGASGDTALGQVVTEKCEGDFLKKLSAKQKRTYQRGIKTCNDKYANMDGTMYRAMAAGCRADLAQSYSRKFGTPR